jgi:hypothetical protein
MDHGSIFLYASMVCFMFAFDFISLFNIHSLDSLYTKQSTVVEKFNLNTT